MTKALQNAALALVLAAAAGAQTNTQPGAVGAELVGQRVIEVIVTSQAHNPLFPWLKSSPLTRQGYAFDLGDGRALTTELLVRNQTLVELRRARAGRKIRATVEISDPQVNLALLRFDAPAADRMAPFPGLAESIGREQTLTILQLDETRQVQRGTASVLQINMTRLPGTLYASLSFKLLTHLNVDGNGAPVLAGSRLAGLMLSYEDSSRTGEMVPYPIIDRFLQDSLAAPYTGFATAGFVWKPLIDPVKRQYLKTPGPEAGIQILSCIQGTGAAAILQAEDVILEWDGYTIDSLGYYDDPEFGRMPISYLIKGRRTPGSSVPAAIVRRGERLNVEVPLNHVNDSEALIPENVEQEPPDYLVQGGLVLQDLTGLYLRSHGPNWRQVADTKLVHLYNTRRFTPSQPGERVVILSRVLPHPINVGYQQFQDRIVLAVNGQPVRNMAEVFRVVDEGDGLERLTLDSSAVDVVLDKRSLKAADAQVAANYGIPELRRQTPRQTTAP